MPSLKPVNLVGIRGRWGVNTPFACPTDQCVEALNIDWFRSTLARKRGGASAISLTGGTAQTGTISFLFSHVPAYDQTLRELWSVDDAATPRIKRQAGGTAFADVSIIDNIQSRPMDIDACSFNGRLFWAQDSNSVNRLHVWDPDTATLRRVGINTPAAPTCANSGGVGTYVNTRYFKVVHAFLSGTTILRRSEASTALTFVPSGVNASATITAPAVTGEGETHWLLYASNNNADFVLIATTIMATTTVVDTNLTGIYTGTTIPTAGTFTCPPSARFLTCDDSRLIMAGAFETTATSGGIAPSPRRIWWTSPLGATDQGDDERVSNTSLIKAYTDVDEAVTGISRPLQGAIYIFSYNSMWKMVGTGVASAPYVRFRVTEGKGCISHRSIVVAQDENGAPCLYWLSPQGPCRLGVGGQFTMVEDITDVWDAVNLEATSVVAHQCYHRDKHQIWWYLSTGGSNDPNTKIVFDTDLGKPATNGKVRGGWSVHGSGSAAARCSTMHSNTLGAAMSRDLKPYIGITTGTAIWKADTGTTDNGTAFQAYLLTRPYTPAGLGTKVGIVQDSTLAAQAAVGVVVTMTINKDMGRRFLNSTATLTPEDTELRVFPSFIGSKLADARTVQFQIGDYVAIDNGWNLDACAVWLTGMGEN